ncbi:uncharacterized protein LOC113312750 [Papaver somniferum]|uniref:uncharacterized protein LOC113312750 n=1 Tax=Papaver somniferum TaxID=3469 RepID=UPI000E6FEBBB|nr:uncharacterized protein LOC113312750 [Papaver somniferum]
MKLPHRIKMFIWECLKNIFPTRVILSQAMHNLETHCQICKQEDETLYHLLIRCKHAQEVWKILNVNIDKILNNCQTVKEWIISWFHNVQVADLDELQNWRARLMVGSWVIWKERCDCVFQDKSLNPVATVSKINHYILNFSPSKQDSIAQLLIDPIDTETHDSIPSYNYNEHVKEESQVFKFYVDASIDRDTNDCGSGIVLCIWSDGCGGWRMQSCVGVFTMGECNGTGQDTSGCRCRNRYQLN